jgi:Spy/CpxP family protein refolding chaperone
MKKVLWLMTSLLCVVPLVAQSPGQPGQNPQGPPPDGQRKWERRGGPEVRGGEMRGGDRMGMTPMGAPFGMWWKNPDVAQKIGLTDDQAQRIDKTFQEHRLRLIDLHADLEKQETLLQPLVDADQPDESKVMAQVDKVAQARAALEKSNASMMLAIRRVLSAEQWKKLQERSPGRKHGFEGPGGPPPQKPQGEGSND